MSDYTELVKALRCCIDDNISCSDCPRFNKCMADRNMSSLFSDAADAIEELQEGVYALQSTVILQSERIQAKDRDLQRVIDAMPRWISVKDRLPEKQGEEYLVAISYPNGETDRVVLWYDLGIEPFFWNRFFVPRGTITHWMPLPSTEGLNET